MLNEIFKGMDNASEAINENFNFGSIVESGENENGLWIKWGNGFAVCWREITFNRDNSSSGSFDKPITFSSVKPRIGGQTTGRDGWQQREDLYRIVVTDYRKAWSFGRTTLASSWAGSGDLNFTVWSAGFVE